jgi:hypothetical protein
MKVGNPIWNTSHLETSSKSPQILNYLKNFRKTDLTELWSDRLLETLVANPSKLGQEVLHGVLQRLYYGMGDMHIPTLKIKEDIKFHIGLIVKQKLEDNFSKSGTELLSSLWILKANTF